MADRELVVLGTASQVPTRERAHHGAALRWDGRTILLDPGEGTQRQLTFARLRSAAITDICITHAHGDHCLGLPGVLQRLSLDDVPGPVVVHAPTAAMPWIERLRSASVHDERTAVELRPAEPGVIRDDGGLTIRAAALSHSIPTLGWRFEEPDRRRLRPELLDAAGVHGPARRELTLTGSVRIGGRRVEIEEVSEARPGQSMAHVMDTRICDGARELAEGVDLLLIEATFLAAERTLAERVGHLTAGQAAKLAQEAGARRVVLTHLSQRYPDLDGHLAEARAAAPELDLVVARDLDRIALPRRRGAPARR